MGKSNTVELKDLETLLEEAETRESIVFDKELLLTYKLKCGFTITGRSACVDPNNFDINLGRKYAKEDAIDRLWKLEGYRLQWELYTSKILDS